MPPIIPTTTRTPLGEFASILPLQNCEYYGDVTLTGGFHRTSSAESGATKPLKNNDMQERARSQASNFD
jgi:hypothetical protein